MRRLRKLLIFPAVLMSIAGGVPARKVTVATAATAPPTRKRTPGPSTS